MTAPALSHKTDQGRFYSHPSHHKDVPSITNIKDMKSIPGLKYFGANEAARYAADNMKTLSALSVEDAYQLIKQSPWTQKGKQATTGKIGDIVHQWIDEVIKGTAIKDIDTSTYIDWDGEPQDAPIQAKWTWNQYAGKGDSFLNIMKPEFMLSEFTVWSDTHNYAGTMDWAARVGGKRLLTLGDNKTGKKVYPDMALQLAAGAFADYMLLPNNDGGYDQVEIPKYDAYAILHLRPRSWSLVPMQKVDEAFQAFIGLRAAFQWKVDCEESTVGNAPQYRVTAEDLK